MGEVSSYVRRGMEFKRRSDLELINDENECIFIEFSGHSVGHIHDIIVGLMYRPPNTDAPLFTDALRNIHSKLTNERKTCILMGDFNIDLLKFQTHDKTNEFLDSLFASSYLPLITKPTRITDYSATLIDNIFCNNPAHHNVISGLLNTDISDHQPIFSLIQSNMNKQQREGQLYQRVFTQNNLSIFKDKIARQDWTFVFDEIDTQTAYSSFLDTIKTAYNEAFPLQLVKSKKYQKNKWLFDNLKQCIKVKNRLYQKFKREPI